MKDLYYKYLHGQLSTSELEKLREQGINGDNNSLEDVMSEVWAGNELNSSKVPDELMFRVKSQIDRELFSKRINFFNYSRIIGWVAAVLLPVFIVSTVYFYRQSSLVESQEMIVSTKNGEKATITLPDGTRVQLNSNSELSYSGVKFNKDERKINFSGEAFFTVTKDKDRPFIIDGKGIKVNVLGTVFNLFVRPNSNKAELSLVSGRVLFSSTLSGKHVTMHPNQKAVLDQNTGFIQLFDENTENMGGWTKNELIFRNAPLSAVVKGLEDVYNVTFEIKSKNRNSELFTGTLSTNDLNGVLEVLERSFNFDMVMYGRKVTVKDSK